MFEDSSVVSFFFLFDIRMKANGTFNIICIIIIFLFLIFVIFLIYLFIKFSVSNEGMDDVQLVEWFWRNEKSSIYVPPLCFLQKFQLAIGSGNEVAA